MVTASDLHTYLKNSYIYYDTVVSDNAFFIIDQDYCPILMYTRIIHVRDVHLKSFG